MAITRNLPSTNISFNRALQKGKKKNDDTPPLERFLSTDTQNRLNLLAPNYKGKMLIVNQKEATSINATSLKNISLGKLEMKTSHFLQVFNLTVAEGIATPGDRAYYGMSASSGAIPLLGSEAQIVEAAEKVVSGEPARVAAGGTANPFPLVADVALLLTDFQTKSGLHSTAAQALDTAQETVTALNTEALGVVKKVWDEVETFYNEEAIESKRANARQYGVVYVSTEAFIVSGRLKLTATGLPPASATIELAETGAAAEYDAASGVFKLTTGLTGEGTLHITSPGLADKDVTVAMTGSDVEVGEVLL